MHKPKQKIILILAVAIVIVVAIVLMGVNTSNDSSQNTTPASKSAAKLKLKPTTGLSYKVTNIVTTSSETTTTIYEHTIDDVSRGTSKINGEVSAVVTSGEVIYNCTSSACTKSNQAGNLNPSSYEFSTDLISTIATEARYERNGTCPAGSCEIWNWTNNTGGQPVQEVLYIDKMTRRISQTIITVPDSATYTATYEFIPVTISIPPNPSEIPSLN